LRDERGLSTYVHCTAGVNRAPTVVIAYLMSLGASLDAAWAEVRAARRVFPLRSALDRWARAREHAAAGGSSRPREEEVAP
jgi:protein-tyrosine phosphatase